MTPNCPHCGSEYYVTTAESHPGYWVCWHCWSFSTKACCFRFEDAAKVYPSYNPHLHALSAES